MTPRTGVGSEDFRLYVVCSSRRQVARVEVGGWIVL